MPSSFAPSISPYPTTICPPHAGLVNSAILYPLTARSSAPEPAFPWRSIWPLPAHGRTPGQRQASASPINQPEARCSGRSMKPPLPASPLKKMDVGPRAIPQPVELDLNAILASVTGSLFATLKPRQPSGSAPRSCRLRVVASTLSWKYREPRRYRSHARRLSASPTPTCARSGRSSFRPTPCSASSGSPSPTRSFRMPDNLWARIVYDFLLAYRLRTINRGHLARRAHSALSRLGRQPHQHHRRSPTTRAPHRSSRRSLRGRKTLPGLALALARPVQSMSHQLPERFNANTSSETQRIRFKE
jgi:hypothetical protein